MLNYVLKRIGLMLFTFCVIFVMIFFLIKLLPLEPLVGSPTQIAMMQARREAFGYNKPIIEQLFIYLKMVFVYRDWGMGETMYPSQNVADIFFRKLPFTMYINVYTVLLSVPIGVGLGIWAALRKNKMTDHVISTSVMLGIALPGFVFAFLIQYFLCFKLGLFRPILESGEGWDMFTITYFKSAIPPILAGAVGPIASLTRMTRAELTEILTNDFMLLARTKGLKRSQATVRHALKNAMVPIFPSILGMAIGIIGGSLIIEQIFAVPGVGQLFLNSINMKDYNFFMMLSAFYTLIGLAAGIVGDLSYGFIDPRIRMGARK